MAPKKATTPLKSEHFKKARLPRKSKVQGGTDTTLTKSRSASQQNGEGGSSDSPSKKRKRATKAETKKKKKPKVEDDLPDPEPSQLQTMRYLLSPAALDVCRPKDEQQELSEGRKQKDYRTYSGSVLTPFEELLSAVILSRPISHALGHRSIRTIINKPYNFTTPKAIRKAGFEKAHRSMFDARTQHKEKTAQEIVKLAESVTEKFGGEDDTTLEAVREQAGHDANKEREILKTNTHGLGNTGLNIFFRRIQWLWTESFPFMDERTSDAAAALGLPDEADELFESIDIAWEELDVEHIEGKDEEERKRRAFVVLLERIIGAQLQKKITNVLREAEKLED